MKKYFLLFFYFSIILNAFSIENFYYSNKEKNAVFIDTNSICILLYPEVQLNDLSDLISNGITQKLSTINKLNLFEIKNLKNCKEVLDNLNSSKLIAYAWYKTQNYQREIIIPTGEIILELNESNDIKEILDLFPNESIIVNDKNKYGVFLLKVINDLNVFNVANRIYESGYVKYCHPNFWSEAIVCSNDLLYGEQYYLKNTGQFGGTVGIDIKVDDAWQISTGSPNVKIAILDDGVESHDELLGRVLSGYTAAINFGNNGQPVLSAFHGQATAGIVAATKDNTIGIAGIASNCKILPINLLTGYESDQQRAAAIDWAWNQGQADILNFGFKTNPVDNITQAIIRAMTNGRFGKGSIVVCPSGNGSSQNGFYPGNINNVITVGAINKNGNIWNYSNTGSHLDLVAPSGDIGYVIGDVRTIDRMGNNGLNNTNYTNTFGGTSAAAPQVAGVAALMLSINPNLTETQVRTLLQQTATDMGSTGFDNTFGYGRVNACAAVQAAQNTLNLFSISGTGSICSGPQIYSITNLPLGASVIWSRIPTNTTSLSQTNNISTLTGTGNGLVVLRADITTSCGYTFPLTKTINVGIPYTLWDVNGCQYPEAVISEDMDGYPCNTQCYSPSNNKWWCAQPVYNATNVTWQKVWSIPSSYNFWSGSWSGNSNNVSIIFKSPNQSVVLKTTISNPCGSIEQYYCFSSTNILCNSNFRTADCKQYEVSIVKNMNKLNIREKNEKCRGINDNQINLIQVVDKMGNIVNEQKTSKKQQEYELDLSSFKSDIYFILLQYDNFVETHQVGILK